MVTGATVREARIKLDPTETSFWKALSLASYIQPSKEIQETILETFKKPLLTVNQSQLLNENIPQSKKHLYLPL